MLQFLQRPKVHLVWKVYNGGTYGEKSELVGVYRKFASAKAAMKRLEVSNEFKYCVYDINTWPLK